MDNKETRTLFGLLLIIGGGVLLTANMGLFILDTLWPLVFGLPALVFIYVFLRDRQSWWAAIPGFTLLGIAGTIAVDQIFRKLGGEWSGSLVLAGIGLGFLAIYIRTLAREWWAIIPGGVMMTLATIVIAEPFVHSDIGAAIFMLGLSLTFGLVYISPSPGGRMRWAIIPAGILFGIGIIGILANTALSAFVWPLILIGLGGYVLLKGFQRE